MITQTQRNGNREITIFIFDCGCVEAYDRDITNGTYRDASDREVTCKQHSTIKETLFCPKCGRKITSLVNKDHLKGRVKVSTAKQQLARHISYSHKNTEEMMCAISHRSGF